jgi:hypothetical protein
MSKLTEFLTASINNDALSFLEMFLESGNYAARINSVWIDTPDDFTRAYNIEPLFDDQEDWDPEGVGEFLHYTDKLEDAVMKAITAYLAEAGFPLLGFHLSPAMSNIQKVRVSFTDDPIFVKLIEEAGLNDQYHEYLRDIKQIENELTGVGIKAWDEMVPKIQSDIDERISASKHPLDAASNYEGLLDLADGDEELVREIIQSDNIDPNAKFNPDEWESTPDAINHLIPEEDFQHTEPYKGEGTAEFIPNTEVKEGTQLEI